MLSGDSKFVILSEKDLPTCKCGVKNWQSLHWSVSTEESWELMKCKHCKNGALLYSQVETIFCFLDLSETKELKEYVKIIEQTILWPGWRKFLLRSKSAIDVPGYLNFVKDKMGCKILRLLPSPWEEVK